MSEEDKDKEKPHDLWPTPCCAYGLCVFFRIMLKDWHWFDKNQKCEMVGLANEHLEPYRLWMDGDYILENPDHNKKDYNDKD